MSFDKAKRLKIFKPDLDDNALIFKANRKVFKSIFALSKYTDIFRFGLDCLII